MHVVCATRDSRNTPQLVPPVCLPIVQIEFAASQAGFCMSSMSTHLMNKESVSLHLSLLCSSDIVTEGECVFLGSQGGKAAATATLLALTLLQSRGVMQSFTGQLLVVSLNQMHSKHSQRAIQSHSPMESPRPLSHLCRARHVQAVMRRRQACCFVPHGLAVLEPRCALDPCTANLPRSIAAWGKSAVKKAERRPRASLMCVCPWNPCPVSALVR
jgi:hypothetical protein